VAAADPELGQTAKWPYPAGHPAQRGVTGYWGSLNSEQEELLRQFFDMVAHRGRQSELAELAELDHGIEFPALRFLRASKWDVEVAVERMEDHLRWRRDFGFREVMQKEPREILECDPADVNRFYPHWQLGFDKQHRPILLKQYGPLEIWNLLEVTTMENLVRYHVWWQQKGIEIMKHKSAQERAPVETYTIILDVEGMSVKQVTRDFLKLVQTIAGIDQNEFPERLGAMFIINVPSIFPFVFRGVKPFLDPETVKKFQIYAKPAEWVPALHEIVDPGTLPPKYGGTGPELPSFTDMNDIIADLQAGGSGIGVAPRTSEEKLRDREGRRASDQRTASVRLRHLDSGHSLDSDYSRHTVYFDASFEIVDVDCCGRVKSLRDPRPMAARRGTPNESSTFRIDTERGNRTVCSSFAYFRKMPYLTLGQHITRLAAFHIVALIVLVGIVAAAIERGNWSSELVQWVMWVFVVLMLQALLHLLVSVVTIFAVKHNLAFTSRILSFINFFNGIFYFSISIACLVLGPSDLNENIDWSDVSEDSDESKSSMVSFVQRYYIAISSVGLVLSILSILQSVMLAVFSRKRKNSIFRTSLHKVDPKLFRCTVALQESRVVLWLCNVLSLMFACVFIGYGGYALNYAASTDRMEPVFTLYMVLVLGMSLAILSVFGIQAANKPERALLWLLSVLSVAFAFALIAWASICFAEMDDTGEDVNSSWTSLAISGDTDGEDGDVDSRTKLSLLVAGCLLIFSGLFMLLNIAALAVALKVLNSASLERLRALYPCLAISPSEATSKGDLALLVWGICTGLVAIFLDGSFAIFSSLVAEHDNWFLGLWIWLGESDSRYVHSDSFLVAISALVALAAGPIGIALVISILNDHSSKYGLGITSALLQIVDVILYWATEMHDGFAHVDSSLPSFWIIFLGRDVLWTILAILVLRYCFDSMQQKEDVSEKLREKLEEFKALIPSHIDHTQTMSALRGKVGEPGIFVDPEVAVGPYEAESREDSKSFETLSDTADRNSLRFANGFQLGWNDDSEADYASNDGEPSTQTDFHRARTSSMSSATLYSSFNLADNQELRSNEKFAASPAYGDGSDSW